MKRSDSDIVDLIVKHVNQEVEALLPNDCEVFGEEAHGLDPCKSDSH